MLNNTRCECHECTQARFRMYVGGVAALDTSVQRINGSIYTGVDQRAELQKQKAQIQYHHPDEIPMGQ